MLENPGDVFPQQLKFNVSIKSHSYICVDINEDLKEQINKPVP